MDKVIDIEERIPSLRERRKKRTNRKFVALLFLFLLLLAVLIYSQTPYSEIQEISVDGAVLYEEQRYITESGLSPGDSMWSFSEADIKKELEQLPWVDKADVQKDWLTNVAITIEEFEPIGFLERGGRFQSLLANGYASDEPVEKIDGPVITGFEDEESREKLAVQLSNLNSSSYQLISQIVETDRIEGSVYMTLYMTDGNEVQIVMGTLAEKLNYYPSVVSQLEDGQKGIFDMEVGVFFRSFDEVYGDGLPEEEPLEGEAVEEFEDTDPE